ncbi:Beta-ketoacyl-[acyl-carrier-protein] synthase III B, chloroplastic [Asimina triloba]
MANASGLISPSIQCIRRGNPSSLGIPLSGFCSVENITRRVIRCRAVLGAEDLALGASPSRPRLPVLSGKGCKLVGCGSALPKLLISNDDLARIVDTSDEWISVRTGIRNRRILSEDETLTGLAVDASRKALDMAQVDPNDVDLILLCTSTPDDLFGSGPQIQKELGCKRNPLSFDIRAACSGFLLGLMTAGFYIRAGGFQNVLVIGADALSRYVDWKDRGTCILFGDAAGAVVVQACNSDEDALLGYDVHSDGDGLRHVTINGNIMHLNAPIKDGHEQNALGSNGAAVFPQSPSAYSCLQMNGKEVFRFAVRCVPQSIEVSLERAGLTCSNIDWLLLHQANQRIIDAVATRLDMPPEQVISNLSSYGNTSAASIPLALDEAVRSGKVRAGNIVAAAGFGAGLTWGSAIVKWG